MPPIESHLWWQRGVIYEIYPRSFADADGDGEGDLAGIRSRLDYLTWLGIDAIWITPFYPSPMVDGGYDVADYCNVDPRFGTLADFDALVADVHARGLKILCDFVPNHTSDQHPWFVESRSSRDNPKRDWYIWRDPAPDGGPPNNWRSEFGGSAWQYDEATGQYYHHAFAAAQPDLNWRNPEVRRAMHDVLRFWLDRGVDGFRVDVMWHVVKDAELRDNPVNPDFVEGRDPDYRRVVPAYSADQPEVHDVVAEMRAVLDEYDERVLIGEIYLPVDRLVAYYGRPDRPGAHMPFNFNLIGAPWDARELELLIDHFEGSLPDDAWPNWVLGNHDQPRIATRLGQEQARVAAVLLLTLRGTPTLYYGDELGLENVDIPRDLIDDVRELNEPGHGFGRDPQRTPMPWESTPPGGGFTTGQPWLPLGEANLARSVAAQRDDPRSMLTLYRRLLGLRRSEPALAVGAYRPVPATGSVLAYRRSHDDREMLVVLNLAASPQRQELPDEFRGGRIVLSATLRVEDQPVDGELEVPGNEAFVIAPPADQRAGSA